MKRLILITGDLATGKTTFGLALSKRYNSPIFYKDRIKELLADTIGFTNREENLRLSKGTMEIMIHAFQQTTEVCGNLILEANFKDYEMERLHRIAEENGYQVLTLLLRADMDIIYRRFVNRIENENRHPAHITGFDGYDSFKNYIEAGRKQKLFGKTIDICADNFSYQTDENLLLEIDRFMK